MSDPADDAAPPVPAPTPPGDPEAVVRLRAEMDALDDALLVLVAQRLTLARALAQAKGGRPGTPDPTREAAIIARLTAQACVPPAAVEQVWGALLTASRDAQRASSDDLNAERLGDPAAPRR